MAKKKEEQNNPVSMENYPRFISNHPKGADLFEGKSQERLAQAVAAHITEADRIETPVFSRLIGLEGHWGSGKSNVIKILEDQYLKGKYTFFYFDAWGNQEDLQRRSILEQLTKLLITQGKLTGKTTMRVMKPEGEGKVEEIPCSWKDKLESLLARKSYSRDITVPSFNGWSKVFVLMLLITGLLIPLLDLVAKNDLPWWANLAIVVGPILLFLLIAWCTGNIGSMWKMYNTEGKSDTTSYVISEKEPSVREFKEWMNEVSNGLPNGEKLVLVFDNMDRLSSQKVHQFWSLIQTFFADDGYKNIWCIVPYDEGHLASVFSGLENEKEREDLLRRYLDKTFPVIYRVPEPIVADYKNIFEALFREAFGAAFDDENLELISQCYRHINHVPNVREIISFINSNVLLAKQWKETINPVHRAVYVLKEDEMLRNPIMTSQKSGKKEIKAITTDEYILANEYSRDFHQILMGNVSVSAMQREIAAMVYGIAPDTADQIVVKRYIRNCIGGEAQEASLMKYVDQPHFMLLLYDDVMNMSGSDFEHAAQLIKDIDSAELNAKDKRLLDNIWTFFANHFIADNASVKEYTSYDRIVFSHVSEELSKRCVVVLCQRLINNGKEVGGAALYEQLDIIFKDDYATGFDPQKVCPALTIESTRFADYVQRAGSNYIRFPLRTNKEVLNKTIEGAIEDTFSYLDVLELLKEDTDYSVAEVGNYAVDQLNLKKAGPLMAANLIAIQRVFFDKFHSTVDANYISTLWQGIQGANEGDAYNEIYVLKAFDSSEQLPHDEVHVNVLSEKLLFYSSMTQQMKLFISNPNVHFRKNILKKMMTENIHDGIPDYPEFIENWDSFVDGLGITRDVVVQFADNWGLKEIPETIMKKSYFDVLPDVAWIDVLLAANTPLAKALLTKCVDDMSSQSLSQFIQVNTGAHTNTSWDKALQKLIGTDYITTRRFGLMASMAGNLLDFVAKNSPVNDPTWNQLLEKVRYTDISSLVNNIRNSILNGVANYQMTPAKFKFLHVWLEQAGINTESHRSDAANQILSKVVDDESCQNIILGNKEYYRTIIATTIDTASDLHAKLKIILEKKGDGGFAEFIRECVDYVIEEDKKN